VILTRRLAAQTNKHDLFMLMPGRPKYREPDQMKSNKKRKDAPSTTIKDVESYGLVIGTVEMPIEYPQYKTRKVSKKKLLVCCNTADCDYTTGTVGSLYRHECYKHTFFKPYKCANCAYECVEKIPLQRHWIQYHRPPREPIVFTDLTAPRKRTAPKSFAEEQSNQFVQEEEERERDRLQNPHKYMNRAKGIARAPPPPIKPFSTKRLHKVDVLPVTQTTPFPSVPGILLYTP
jgi:hypothetical protein